MNDEIAFNLEHADQDILSDDVSDDALETSGTETGSPRRWSVGGPLQCPTLTLHC